MQLVSLEWAIGALWLLCTYDLWPQVHLGFQPVSQWSHHSWLENPLGFMYSSCISFLETGGFQPANSATLQRNGTSEWTYKDTNQGGQGNLPLPSEATNLHQGYIQLSSDLQFFSDQGGVQVDHRLFLACFSHEVSTRPLNDAKKHHDFRFSGHLGHREKTLQKGIHENNWDTLLGSNISYPLPRHFWVDDVPISRYVGYGLLSWRVSCQGHLEILLRASERIPWASSNPLPATPLFKIVKDHAKASAFGEVYQGVAVPAFPGDVF